MVRISQTSRLLLCFVILFAAFWLKGNLFLDPDFGWRLKTGELVLTQGIPETDPFTYTMPSFPWVDHAWSQSLLMYIAHSLSGYAGLALVYSLFAVLALWITNKRLKLDTVKKLTTPKYFIVFPFFLFVSILFTFFGVRAQVLSWLMHGVLLFILFEPERFKRLRNFLPLFFLFSVNLHGSFASGLATFFLFVIVKAIRERKIDRGGLIIFFSSILITLINPYGAGVWREVWSSISDSSLRWTIVEWMPALIMLDVAMVVLMGISLALTLRYRKKITLEEKVLYFVFLLQAMASRRHLPLWALVAYPITVRGVYFVWLEAKKYKGGVERFRKMNSIAWVFCLIVFFTQSGLALHEAYLLGFGDFYPKKAVTFLTRNIPEGEIFSEYGWGGYLVWKLPEKKVFIDGRMPSWRWKPGDEAELASAFDTYTGIQKGEIDYKEVFKKYEVSTVLWSKAKKETPIDKLFSDLEDYLVVFGLEKDDYDFLTDLESNGWKKNYEDNVAVIYENPDFSKKSE